MARRHRCSTLTAVVLGAALGTALLPVFPPPAARAQDPAKPGEDRPVGQATDVEARDALAVFEGEFAAEDPGRRADALRRLAKVDHPTVASRILLIAAKDGEALVRVEAFRSLAPQKCAVKTWSPKVAAWLADAAAGIRAARAKWDFGILVDAKTGEPDLVSEAGRAALRRKRDRSLLCLEAARLLRGIAWRDKSSAPALAEFLPDGNDDLVVLALETLGTWKEWSALPAMAELFRMYPDEENFAGAGVAVDTGASGDVDQAEAKRRFSARYGDPDLQRGRPRVNAAVKKALREITGREFRTPAELVDYLRRPEVRKKVKGG